VGGYQHETEEEVIHRTTWDQSKEEEQEGRALEYSDDTPVEKKRNTPLSSEKGECAEDTDDSRRSYHLGREASMGLTVHGVVISSPEEDHTHWHQKTAMKILVPRGVVVLEVKVVGKVGHWSTSERVGHREQGQIGERHWDGDTKKCSDESSL
jgi:hypothetical protein